MNSDDSQGLLYSLYILPRLAQSGIKVNAWVMTSPWVPPWLSGSMLLSVARLIPAGLTGRLGTVGGFLESCIGPLGTVFGWSSGIAREAVSFSGGLLGAGSNEAAAPTATPTSVRTRGKLSPEQQYLLAAKKDAAKPPHKRGYGWRFHNQATVDLGMKVLFAEGLDSIGAEALVCLAKGEGASWGWGHEEDGSVDPQRQYERGFEALRRAWGDNPRSAPRAIQVWYGKKDALVPRQGREYLRGLLVERLGLVERGDWHEIREAGHDDPLGLNVWAEGAMGLFREAAAASAAQ